MAEAREAARKKYDEAYASLREGVKYGFEHGGTSPLLSAAIPAFNAGLADLMLTGLDEYIAEAAKDRASAVLDRQAMALDREDQRKARWGMAWLTGAIVLLTVVMAFSTAASAFRKSPSPIVNIAVPPLPPSPVATVTIQPVPVNVTLAPPTRPREH
jgi:hypothetical protein